MFVFLKRLIHADDGVTAVEYALIAALVSVAVVAGSQAIGSSLAGVFTSLAPSFVGG